MEELSTSISINVLHPTDLQQKIDQVCGGKEYQSLVEEVQRDIESTQE